MKKATILCFLLCPVLACASIAHGTSQDVYVTSQPSAAAVTVDEKPYGPTPVSVHLKRDESHVMKIELPGYLPYESRLNRGVSGWIWGNILFGGVLGVVIDVVDGAMYTLTPEQLQAEMHSTDAKVTNGSGDGIMIAVTMAPQPGWKKVAQLDRQ